MPAAKRPPRREARSSVPGGADPTVVRSGFVTLAGRPNVGKSSLFNRLVGEERSVVYEEAGTTRDAVDALVSWPDGPVRFVDTAGFRRPSRVQGVEYYSFLRAERAIERSRDNWYAHLQLALAEDRRGRAEPAARALAEAVRLNPSEPVLADVRARLARGERVDLGEIARVFRDRYELRAR